jgi:hypothetical protein
MKPDKKTVYAPQRHTFFDDLVTMIYSLFALDVTVSTFTILNLNGIASQRRPEREVLFDIRRPLQGDTAKIVFDINSTGGRFEIPLMDIQPHINLGSWPQFIEVFHYSDRNIDQASKLTTRSPIYRRVVGASFVNYYQSQESNIKNKYKDGTNSWPDFMNFFRIIRNGFAHGGKISFDKPSMAPVSWKKWTYSPADNGKEFLLVPGGLAIGDLILLFEELHQELHQ